MEEIVTLEKILFLVVLVIAFFAFSYAVIALNHMFGKAHEAFERRRSNKPTEEQNAGEAEIIDSLAESLVSTKPDEILAGLKLRYILSVEKIKELSRSGDDSARNLVNDKYAEKRLIEALAHTVAADIYTNLWFCSEKKLEDERRTCVLCSDTIMRALMSVSPSNESFGKFCRIEYHILQDKEVSTECSLVQSAMAALGWVDNELVLETAELPDGTQYTLAVLDFWFED